MHSTSTFMCICLGIISMGKFLILETKVAITTEIKSYKYVYWKMLHCRINDSVVLQHSNPNKRNCRVICKIFHQMITFSANFLFHILCRTQTFSYNHDTFSMLFHIHSRHQLHQFGHRVSWIHLFKSGFCLLFYLLW